VVQLTIALACGVNAVGWISGGLFRPSAARLRRTHYSCCRDIFETIIKQLLMNVVWATDEQQKTEYEMMRRNNVFGTPAGVVDSVAVGGTDMPGPVVRPVDVSYSIAVMMPRRAIVPEPWSRLLLPVFLRWNGRGGVFARRFRMFGQNKI